MTKPESERLKALKLRLKADKLEQWYTETTQDNRDIVDSYTRNLAWNAHKLDAGKTSGKANLGERLAHEVALAVIYFVATNGGA